MTEHWRRCVEPTIRLRTDERSLDWSADPPLTLEPISRFQCARNGQFRNGCGILHNRHPKRTVRLRPSAAAQLAMSVWIFHAMHTRSSCACRVSQAYRKRSKIASHRGSCRQDTHAKLSKAAPVHAIALHRSEQRERLAHVAMLVAIDVTPRERCQGWESRSRAMELLRTNQTACQGEVVETNGRADPGAANEAGSEPISHPQRMHDVPVRVLRLFKERASI